MTKLVCVCMVADSEVVEEVGWIGTGKSVTPNPLRVILLDHEAYFPGFISAPQEVWHTGNNNGIIWLLRKMQLRFERRPADIFCGNNILA